ncbi:MAG: ATP-binding protein [Chloroflexi bacterium]|nr:ATP-binding protein [Chloroflexota bacterium]
MALANLRPDAISKQDLQALIDDQVSEGTTIDYKAAPYGTSDEDRREFLFDVSSFANAAGGHLILGMRAAEGIPTDLCGLDNLNVDETKLRYENMLRDNIKPRLPGVGMGAVLLGNGKHAFVIHIPRSFATPHMVEFRQHTWFYSRNSAGKYRLDVDQLRTTFLQSATLPERVHRFRLDRLTKIADDDTPVRLAAHPKVVVHLVPLAGPEWGPRLDPAAIARQSDSLLPLNAPGSRHRFNFDGYLTYLDGSQGAAEAYVQVFRDGAIEAVEADLLRPDPSGHRHIPILVLEHELIDKLPRYLAAQQALGIEPPILIMVSLLAVEGRTIPRMSRTERVTHPIDRPTLNVPAISVDTYDGDMGMALRPAFDTIWNAGGYPRCPHYDEAGQWTANRR